MKKNNRYQLEAKYMSFENIEITDEKDIFKLLDYGHFLHAKNEDDEKLTIFKYKRKFYVYKVENDILNVSFKSKEEFTETMFRDYLLLRKVSKKFVCNLHDFHVKFSFMNINRENLKMMIEGIRMIKRTIGIHTITKDKFTLTMVPELLLIHPINEIGEKTGKYSFAESMYYINKKFQDYKSIILTFTYTKSNVAFVVDKETEKMTKEKFDELVNQISDTQTEELDNITKNSFNEYKEYKKYYPNSTIFLAWIGILYLDLSIIVMNLQKGSIFFGFFFSVFCVMMFLKYQTVDRRKENLITIKTKNNKPYETSMYYPRTIDIVRFVVLVIVAALSQLDGILPLIIYLVFMFTYAGSYKKLYKKYTGDGKD